MAGSSKGLHLVVLVKQVPDTQNITGQAMKEDGTVNRSALPAIFNPEDLHALEAALRIKETCPGSRVSVLTMGPPAAEQVLRESLYRGADAAALVSDRAFAGADTLATSYALSCAVRRLGEFDLVVCGRQAIDGDTAQVGPQTAEKLGIDQVTCVREVERVDAAKRELVAVRGIEGGHEKVRARLPLLLSFTDEGNEPRPPSVKRMLAFRKARAAGGNTASYGESYLEAGEKAEPAIQLWDLAAIRAKPEQCGLAGSPTKVKKIESVVLKSAGTRMVANSDEAITGLVHELVADHTLG